MVSKLDFTTDKNVELKQNWPAQQVKLEERCAFLQSYKHYEDTDRNTLKKDNQTAKFQFQSYSLLLNLLQSFSWRKISRKKEEWINNRIANLQYDQLTFKYGDKTVVAGFRKADGSPFGFSKVATHSCHIWKQREWKMHFFFRVQIVILYKLMKEKYNIHAIQNLAGSHFEYTYNRELGETYGEKHEYNINLKIEKRLLRHWFYSY